MDNDIKRSQRRPVLVDGVRRRPPAPAPMQIAAPAVQTTPIKPRVYARSQPEQKSHKFWQKLQLPLLLIIGAAGGFFAETLPIGLAMLAIYAVVALVTRIPSRTTFTLALLLLGGISAMLLLKPSMPLIRNFATYAFILLLIGAITLVREARLPKRTRRKRTR